MKSDIEGPYISQ